jgi:hypothetical protein
MVDHIQSQSAITQKSTFVNVIAWIFIIFAGFGTLISLLQNFMFGFMFPQEQMNEAMNSSEVTEQMPILFEFMFNNMGLFLFVILLLTLFTFISAIALLKRKNWARIYFIVILSFGVLWNIGGAIMQQTMFSSMAEMPGEAAAPPEFQSAMAAMRIGTIVFAIVICGLLGWIIKKLISENIKEEFI